MAPWDCVTKLRDDQIFKALSTGLSIFIELISFTWMHRKKWHTSPLKNNHSEKITLHKKWSFPFRISPVNVTKSAVSYGFGHIYRRNPEWKTTSFVQCILKFMKKYIVRSDINWNGFNLYSWFRPFIQNFSYHIACNLTGTL